MFTCPIKYNVSHIIMEKTGHITPSISSSEIVAVAISQCLNKYEADIRS